MKIWVEYSVKDFDRDKLLAAIDACKQTCEGCEIGLEACMRGANECSMKDAIEALEGMERVGRGVRRYKEIKGFNA